jgi:septal ring factor EnvC (AmiA/AmiB activator)
MASGTVVCIRLEVVHAMRANARNVASLADSFAARRCQFGCSVLGLYAKRNYIGHDFWHVGRLVHLGCSNLCLIKGASLQGREALQRQLDQSEEQAANAAAAHEAECQRLQRHASKLEERLADVHTDLGVARLDLKTAQAQQQAMSASVDMVEGSLEEVQSALSAARTDLSATKAALNEVNNAKLALEARLKASEVRCVRKSCPAAPR